MHRADPDIARGLMKNMAEMALCDTELAAGIHRVFTQLFASIPADATDGDDDPEDVLSDDNHAESIDE